MCASTYVVMCVRGVWVWVWVWVRACVHTREHARVYVMCVRGVCVCVCVGVGACVRACVHTREHARVYVPGPRLKLAASAEDNHEFP